MKLQQSLITLCGILGSVLSSSLARAADAPVASRPNVVFIYTDDQRWDGMGVVQREMGDKARFPWLKTPNMDRLAAEGVRFRNAFVCESLCSPSRATFLTGRYGHLHGIINNKTPFPANAVSWAGELRKLGYTTGYIGKWHMGNKQKDRPGFDYSASYLGHGRYQNAPFFVNGKSVHARGWVDDVATNFAIDFIQNNHAKPFALVVGYKTPHEKPEPPARSRNLYPGAQARPVPNLKNFPPRHWDPVRPPNAEYIRNYFRCISAMDDDLGRLLKTLDDLKLTDNTIVIFCTDNGYYLNEHGLGDKRSAYDESMRIPFLVRYPRLAQKGVAHDEMVLNLDVAPTLLDLAGVNIPASMQGRSLRPLLEGKPIEWRKSWLYEYFKDGKFPTPTCFAVRTDTAKLIKYPGHDDWIELFDLKSDPYETKNLAHDPAHKDLLQTLQAEFDRQAKAVDLKTPSPDPSENSDNSSGNEE